MLRPTTHLTSHTVDPHRPASLSGEAFRGGDRRTSGGIILPNDSVVYSSQESPAGLILPAERRYDPPYRPPHEEHRAGVMPKLFAYAEALHNKELEGEAFQNAALQLMELRDRSPDPLVQRQAKNLVIKHFKWKTNAQDWAMKAGPIEGPTRALNQHFQQMTERFQRGGAWEEQFLYPHLDTLEKNAARVETVPQETVASMVHGSRILRARADQNLDEEIRQKEPPENDHRWSQRISGMVQEWWRKGQFELSLNGSEVQPDQELDFHHLLTNPEAIVEVRGRQVEIRETRGPRGEEKDEIQKFLYRFSTLHQTRDQANAAWPELDELIATDPKQATHLLDRAVEMVFDDPGRQIHGARCLKNLLDACDERPALKTLIAPHAQRLSSLGELTRARGLYLKKDNLAGEDLARFYHSLLKQFPDLLTGELVERQLSPILFNNWGVNRAMPEVLEWLCEERPDLSDTVARQAINGEEGFPGKDTYQMLSMASKHGWKPQPEQLQWLVDWMTSPRCKEDSTILSEYYFALAGLAADLEERDPGCWDRFRTFNLDGQLQPVRHALLHMLVHDRKTDLSVLVPKEERTRGVGVEQLYRWLAPESDALTGNPGPGATLMAFAAQRFKADQSLEQQEPAVKKALVVLSALPRSPEVHGYFEELLEPYQATSPRDHVLGGVLDEYRARTFEPRALEALRRPGLSLEEKLSRAVDFVVLNQRGVGDKIFNSERLEQGLEAISECLADEDPKKLAQICSRQVGAAVAQAKDLKKENELPARTRAEVVLAVHLAAKDDSFLNQVKAELEGLSEKSSYGWDLLSSMKRKAASDRNELNWEMARAEVLAQPELKSQTERLLQYLVEDGARDDKAYDQYGELVKARGPVAQTARMLEHLKVATSYRQGQATTETQAKEILLARELIDRDPGRRELYHEALEPIWLTPLGEDPVGRTLQGLRRDRLYSLENQLWSRGDEEPLTEDQRLSVLEKGLRLGQAAGEEPERFTRDWRSYHQDEQHWTGKICALYPKHAHQHTAEVCLAIQSGQRERDEQLFHEVFESFGTPTRHAEIMRAFELVRWEADSGAEGEAAVQQVYTRFKSVVDGLRSSNSEARHQAYSKVANLGVIQGEPPRNQVDHLAYALALVHSTTEREHEWFNDFQRLLNDANDQVRQNPDFRNQVRAQALEIVGAPEPNFSEMSLLEQSRYHLLSTLSGELTECAPFTAKLQLAMERGDYPSLWNEVGGAHKVAHIEAGLEQLAEGQLSPRRQGEILEDIFAELRSFHGDQRKRLEEQTSDGWWKRLGQTQPESALALETLQPAFAEEGRRERSEWLQLEAYQALLRVTDTREQLPGMASRMAALKSSQGEAYEAESLAAVASSFTEATWAKEESRVFELLTRFSGSLDENSANQAVTSLVDHQPSRERGFLASAEQLSELLDEVQTFPMAWGVHRFIEKQVEKGMDREQARAEGLKLYVMGLEPDTLASHDPRPEAELDFEVDAEEIRVGSIALPVQY